MDSKIRFKDLESTVKFLNKVLLNPDHDLHLSRYQYYYLLQAEMIVQNNDKTCTIYFCGTNHSSDPNERRFIDSLLANVTKGDLVLIEQGQGITGYCENNIRDDLKKRLSEKDSIVEGVNVETLFNASLGEMTYAAELACSKGARAKNIDAVLNPEALQFVNALCGTKATIEQLERWLQEYFRTSDGLNKYIHYLLSNSGINIQIKEIDKIKPIDVHKEVTPLNDSNRDHYMTNEILKELRNPLYVITNTVHIKGILNRLKKQVGVVSFSAILTHNSKAYNWATGENVLFSSSKQRLAMYRLINSLLYEIT